MRREIHLYVNIGAYRRVRGGHLGPTTLPCHPTCIVGELLERSWPAFSSSLKEWCEGKIKLRVNTPIFDFTKPQTSQNPTRTYLFGPRIFSLYSHVKGSSLDSRQHTIYCCNPRQHTFRCSILNPRRNPQSSSLTFLLRHLGELLPWLFNSGGPSLGYIRDWV